MKAVHFGAGNIGRGFIGLLLSKSGYEVCFVDVNQDVVNEINCRGKYTVRIADAGQEEIEVEGVRAVNSQDEEAVVREIIQADFITTAVGPSILPLIAPTIRHGIRERVKENQTPLHVIACENMVGGSTVLKQHVLETLTEEERDRISGLIGFPDSAVDRIVPNQQHEDRLTVEVEPFFEWIIDRSKFQGEVPPIQGALYVDDLTPYIERKLFTVNTGHAIAAYLGYHYGISSIEKAVTHSEIRKITLKALGESGEVLVRKYTFPKEEHQAYIHKILTRFENPYLADEVTRIGRSPVRKLGFRDRLVNPASQALEFGITPEGLATGMAAALLFDYAEDPEANQIQETIREEGLPGAIKLYTGLGESSRLSCLIQDKYKELNSN